MLDFKCFTNVIQKWVSIESQRKMNAWEPLITNDMRVLRFTWILVSQLRNSLIVGFFSSVTAIQVSVLAEKKTFPLKSLIKKLCILGLQSIATVIAITRNSFFAVAYRKINFRNEDKEKSDKTIANLTNRYHHNKDYEWTSPKLDSTQTWIDGARDSHNLVSSITFSPIDCPWLQIPISPID